MGDVETNYFVCTLGQTAIDGVPGPFSTVNDLISKQASTFPDRPAIGFYVGARNSGSDALETRVLTFKDVQIGTLNAAQQLSQLLRQYGQGVPGTTIGILMASSPEFLFTWLGLVQLVCPVLLIAPQCSPSAIAHLCRTCKVALLLTDEDHEALGERAFQVARDSTDQQPLRTCIPAFVSTPSVWQLVEQDQLSEYVLAKPDSDAIAYLHHTSGTSSGLPKPIPQSHYGAVGVLPSLDGQSKATFTTTPLYHGGPADIFRAWTSGAMIWLFPSKDLPITASNIQKCLQTSANLSEKTLIPTIKYFTSVPYVLQIMAVDEKALSWLQCMDLVGVGGAALPTKIGDQLVRQGVKLVSRFGSAECGFVLSSHRDYERDCEWQFLRSSGVCTGLEFESRDDDLHELVIKPGWPHMAKTNRPDGSYATSDLFERHASLSNAWRYHSRADSQITLITGKKFDPAPLEHDLVANLPDISDVLIFGDGRPYPGALLFRSPEAVDKRDKDILLDAVKAVERLNMQIFRHANLPHNMLVLMPHEQEPLPKSSKGTIMRNLAWQRYKAGIDDAYDRTVGNAGEINDAEVLDAIKELVAEFCPMNGTGEIDISEDLFLQGVDSVACVQIRHGISSLLPKDAKPLPLTIVEDCGTVEAVARAVVSLRHGHQLPTENRNLQISDLVQKYSKLDPPRPVESTVDQITTLLGPPSKNILLTGATGSLGSHVLHSLLLDPDIHVHVLVRGATPQAARERVLKALTLRKLPLPDNLNDKLTILRCKLSEHDLGIDLREYSRLVDDVDIVLHLAWSVNFLIPLQSFANQFEAIQNLLNLCLASTRRKPARFVFCSSVAAVANQPFLMEDANPKGVPESVLSDTRSSGPTGYAQSKLTAELILASAATRMPVLRDRITIVRVGQLSADTELGVWNASEAYPQILATAKLTSGALPDLGDQERLTWLPVDIAAKAFIEASFTEPGRMDGWPTQPVKQEFGKSQKTVNHPLDHGAELASCSIDTAALKVLHLVNPDSAYSFTDFLRRLQQFLADQSSQSAQGSQSGQINIVNVSDWLQQLEKLSSDARRTSEAQKLLRLLPFWKQAYAQRTCPASASPPVDQNSATGGNADPDSSKADAKLAFDMHNSLLTMPSLAYWLGLSTYEGGFLRGGSNDVIGTGPPNELLRTDYVGKVWKWVQANVP